MRLVPGGPDIPNALIAEQQRGNVLFVCGAGVSMAAGLPSFRSLVIGIYRHLGENWEPHPAERAVMEDGGRLATQYDRVLRTLERRLEASNVRASRGMRHRLREAVEQALAPNPSIDLPHHRALLELSKGKDGAIRLLTTNFDTLFERSWVSGGGPALPSHAGPGMPRQGTGAFEGVLHLHGRVEDQDMDLDGTDLVLTSAEFGDAYLRSGWATRYVYDLARAHTLVLFGYSADDPPMRYLLEVLEDDRARYPDLKPVYAFASSPDGDEHLERELWRAKGIEAILYRSTGGADHANLYATLEEWQRYVADPTAWRERRLREVFAADPAAVGADAIAEAVDLLAHGDAATLLTRLTPSADWWTPLSGTPPLSEKTDAHAAWLRGRIGDVAMVRACVASPPTRPQVLQAVLRRIPQLKTPLPPVLAKAWRLLARAAQERARNDAGAAWLVLHRITTKDIDQSVREGVSEIVRPRLGVEIPFITATAVSSDPADQLKELLQVSFEPHGHLTVQQILTAWPAEEAESLFIQAERVLAATLDEAADAGYLSGLDRASYSVKSIGSTGFPLLDTGFTPIVRLITGLWAHIAAESPARAAVLASRWRGSAHLLLTRLYLDAVSDHAVYPNPAVPIAAVNGLDDRDFWVNDSTREIRHLFVSRWLEFPDADRDAMETRVRAGPPRHLARQDELVTEDAWQVVWDQLVFQHLESCAERVCPSPRPRCGCLSRSAGATPKGRWRCRPITHPCRGQPSWGHAAILPCWRNCQTTRSLRKPCACCK
jgi:SIR2-like domain